MVFWKFKTQDKNKLKGKLFTFTQANIMFAYLKYNIQAYVNFTACLWEISMAHLFK